MNIQYIIISLGQLLGSPAESGIPDQQLSAGSLTSILNAVYLVAAVVAVVMAIIGGILLITSTGDAGKSAKARNTLLYSVIGLVVVASAFAITNFVIERL